MQITDSMRWLRAAPLDVRRSVYETGRINDQSAWYAAKADQLASGAGRWAAAGLILTGAGLVGGMLKALGLTAVDLLGVASALAASTTAWMQLK